MCASAYRQWHWHGRKDKKGQSAGDRRQGGREWKTRQQEVTEARHQRVQLSDVHIFSHCRDHNRCHGSRKQVHEWFGESGRFCLCPNWQACIAKVDTAVCLLGNWTHCLSSRSIDSVQRRREGANGNRKRVTYGPTTREAEEVEHLPGYVSVTSKKEERRDTWSESNKSVQANIIRTSSKTTEAEGGSDAAFSCMSGVSATRSQMQKKTTDVSHRTTIEHSFGNILYNVSVQFWLKRQRSHCCRCRLQYTTCTTRGANICTSIFLHVKASTGKERK